MRRSPVLRMDLLNRKRNQRAVWFVLLVFVFNIFCDLDWYVFTMTGDGTQEMIVVFLLGMQTLSYFFPIMLSVAAAASIYSYCSEWKNGYWKPIVERVGKACYLREKPVACFLQSFLIYFAGVALYAVFLVVSAKLKGAPMVYEDLQLSSCPIPEHPYLYLLMCCLSLSMSAGFWGSLAFLLASWQMDLFLALMVPLSGYFSLSYLLNKSALHISLDTVAVLATDPKNPYISLLISVIVFSVLSVLCMSGARKLMTRRMENEHVA